MTTIYNMIITLTPTHIACLSLGLSCEWGAFFVDSNIRDQWVTAVGRQRLVVNCEHRVIRHTMWRWHLFSCRLRSVDPVVIYPFLDWVRAHQLRVTQWVIDGKDPFRYSKRLRLLFMLCLMIGGLGWAVYHRLTPPSPLPPTVRMASLRLTDLQAMLEWVTTQGGVIIRMGCTPHQAHLSALLPAQSTLASSEPVTETPLTNEWKGVTWQRRYD